MHDTDTYRPPLRNWAAAVLCALALVSPLGLARESLPQPTVSFTFDQDDARLQAERGKAVLMPEGVRGKALQVGDPENRLYWQIPAAGTDWTCGTVSFWFKPLDWQDPERYHHWLHTVGPNNSPMLNLVVLNYVERNICFQLKDLGSGPGIHCWYHSNLWENGRWYFVTATWDRQTQAVYLNGELDERGGGKQDITQVLRVPSDLWANHRMYIGTDAGWKAWPTEEKSLMDELEFRPVALTAEQVRQLYYEQKPAAAEAPERPPAKSVVDAGVPFPAPARLTVPLGASAPELDGRVNEKEWADATCFAGLVDIDSGFLTDEDFKGYVKSDGKKLYLAFQRIVQSVELLKINTSGRDAEAYYDDSWELYLYPQEGNGDYYQVVANATDAVFDWYKGDTKWNGAWEIRQHLERPSLWEMELAIPLAELGVQEAREGELFRFGFFFNQKVPRTRLLGWTTQMGLFANIERAATLVFSRTKPALGVKDLGKPTAGLWAPVLRGAGEVPETSLVLQLPSGQKTSRLVRPGQLDQPTQFPPLQGRGVALVTVSCPAGAPAATADLYYSAVVQYDSVPLTVRSTNYPSRQRVCWEINYAALDRPERVRKYRVDFGPWSTVCRRTEELPWDKFEVPTARLKPGDYKATIALLDKDDKEIAAQHADYTKEGGEPWRHNNVGIEPGYVPPPYTPMQVQQRAVEIIGRRLDLAATGLPERIRSNGTDLLQAPVTLRGELNHEVAELTARRPFAFSTVQPDDSSGSAKVRLGPLQGTLKQTISFDGFCWYELELEAGRGVLARDVALEIRLPKDVVKNYILTDTDFKTTKLGEWDIWGPLTKNLSLGVIPQVWLGNTEVGLAWLMESHQGWQVADEGKVLEVRIEGDAVLFRANIVDEPLKLKGKLKLSFGLQATPIHPLTARQQRLIIGAGRAPEYPADAKTYWVYMGHDPSKPETFVSYAGLPEPAHPDQALLEAKKLQDQVYLAPYSEFTWLSMGLKEMKVYGGDWYLDQTWGGTAGSAADPEPFGLVDTENRDYQDFIVWRFVKNWNSYGGHAVYYDLLSPHQNKVPRFQQGYRTRTGEIAYPWPIRSVREIARRMFIGYRQHNPDFAVFGHASNMYLPITAFIDAWPTGEYFVFVTNRYPEVLTYERYQAFLYGYPLGLRTMFLPSMKMPALIRTDLTHYLVGVVFNHNTTFWLCFCDQGAVQPYLSVYHGGDWAMQEFLPYWKYPQLTHLDPAKFKVSGWYNRDAKEGLLCIASLSADPVTVPVSLGEDWAFRDTTTLVDACKETLKGWTTTYPSGQTALVGDYAYYLGAGKLGATFDEQGNAAFKPYGVLMLNVKK
jgi:hypothetical protein